MCYILVVNLVPQMSIFKQYSTTYYLHFISACNCLPSRRTWGLYTGYFHNNSPCEYLPCFCISVFNISFSLSHSLLSCNFSSYLLCTTPCGSQHPFSSAHINYLVRRGSFRVYMTYAYFVYVCIFLRIITCPIYNNYASYYYFKLL